MKIKLSALLITIVICLPTIAQAQITLYGLTGSGGTNWVGSVFSITPSGNFNIIANLNSTFAANATGSLLYASDGNFYATSMDGGYEDSCTVFRCNPNGTLYTMINLDSVWGSSSPNGNGLIQAKDGNLYGMTTQGGPYGFGVIFKLELSGQYSALHFFTGIGTDGANPYGSLIQTEDGTLWGVTSQGGYYDMGTIFKCSTSGIFNTLFSFNDTNGISPHGDLVLANDGNFYGMSSGGGNYYNGTLFRFSPTGKLTKLIDFNDTNGATPYGSLIQANDGNLYGMTAYGGDSGKEYGTIFKYTISGNLTTLVVFDDTNGAHPYGSLMQAKDGNLYGMTSQGGANDSGTIFKCSLSGNFTKIFDFDFTTGCFPVFGALIEVDTLKEADVPSISKINLSINVYPNPSNGIFTVSLGYAELVSAPQAKIEVYNMLGERVFNETLKQVQGDNSINLSSQLAGVYLYRVLDANGNLIGEGKLIIEK